MLAEPDDRGARWSWSTVLAEHAERGARCSRSIRNAEHAERGARGTRHGMLAERAGGEQWSEKWSDEWAGDRGLRGRFSGRIGRLESLPRYAPILILEQAITGTVPGSACGKASVLAKNGAFLQASRGRHVGGLARFIRRRSRAAAQSVPISQPLALGSLPPAPVMQASQSFRSSQSLLGGITGRRGFSGAILRRRPLPGAIPRRRAPFRGDTRTQEHR